MSSKVIHNNNTSQAQTQKAKKKRRGAKKSKMANGANPAHLPEKPSDISSNWIALLSSLPKDPPPPSKRPRFKPQQAPKANKCLKPIQAKAPDIWFDDVDETLLDPEDVELLHKAKSKSTPVNNKNLNGTKTQSDVSQAQGNGLVKEQAFKGLTKIIAIDCEMVGVGPKGRDSVLARVSIVNHFGHCIFDKYVKPEEKVTDYRTAVSGIRKSDLEKGEDFKKVQMEVAKMFQDRIVVGHAIKHDLDVLLLTHPKKLIRDTSTYKPFREAFNNRTPSLKKLSARMLGVTVQEGEHSSVQDAQATMRLYTMFRKEWEESLKQKRNQKSGAIISKVAQKANIKGKTEVAMRDRKSVV